jgi:hypothetical protein
MRGIRENIDKKLENDLEREFRKAAEVCINLYKYRPSYFLQMLDNYGAVGTSIKLVTAPEFHEGFTKLWELGRLDLTVEAIILQNPYNKLFSKEVLEKAFKRLKALGYEGKLIPQES